ncbi:beta-ketoacyl-[acyl-carrier-protein] synthase family protein [Pedobacter jamesrossensis]|uniref:3-oxoacyl-[acyl-carrier-protein] synthase 1 n=1 Tax=Pedobacter jamesrossensis TaxID=1908238 RepID=A0ABV8NJX5_9SPHI
MNQNRVVITGLGVCAPNGTTVEEFRYAIENGVSGISHQPELERLGFSCQIAGKPNLDAVRIAQYFTPLEIRNLDSSGIVYGVIAGLDAWRDSGLEIADTAEPDWDSGTFFGTGTSGIDKFRWAINKIDELEIRKLGSSVVAQTMASGVSAFISGKIGFGNRVSTNSAACATGTESILMAYEHIKSGKAKRMLAGSTSDSGPYIWGGFDAMKVCTFKHNDSPESGSRPMSKTASGFVPGSGAGALVLESLESAVSRNARIYAEIIGGHINSGGQRGEGTMTAPNSVSVQRCILKAIEDARIKPGDIDVINGHLTATSKDALEIENWKIALGCSKENFPYINSLKGMIGHCISAAGSIECVASVLQLHEGFIFPNINCKDLNLEISSLIDERRVPRKLLKKSFNILAKASFGFGDVNACLILKKYHNG